ncbi:MAG: patatin-like phospholipase family protein [Candidatus Omnitrophota bacterium]|nr:MAG: patatin-like phospholipase family protein [Candidatus Omnitrophota bacterium]
MDKKELRFIIRNTPPFNKLKPREIDKFIDICELKEYSHTQTIYQEGNAPDYLYLLIQGRISAITKQAQKDIEIEHLGRGTCFGLISLFTGEPHSVTTKSLGTSFVVRVDQNNFRKFLETCPKLSFDFSRILSQRVKARTHPKTIFKTKTIAVCGPHLTGKTTYMFDLARRIKKEINKKVLCIEFSTTKDFALPSLINSSLSVFNLRERWQESVFGHIVAADADLLLVKIEDFKNISALLHFLSENYHFILFEVPHQIQDSSLDEFILSASDIHLLVFSQLKSLKNAKTFISTLKRKYNFEPDKIKVALAEFAPKERLSFSDKKGALNHHIYATLSPKHEKDYPGAIRRIARESAETVVGLALGSGGAYCFSHIGVLKVLEQNNIAVDVVCGSSMGALIAALWASDFSIEEIKEIANELGKQLKSFFFPRFSIPFRGFFRAKRLEKIMHRFFKDKTFYDVKRTLKIVAFDFLKKEARILQEGPLYKAVSASCAVPGIFEPVMVKKDILLDGGILNPLPTRALLNYNVHKIIAVDITPSRAEIVKEYQKRKQLHIFDFIFGSIETMQRELIREAAGIADVTIHPRMEGLGWVEFEKAEDFIKRGEEAASEMLEDIKKAVLV